MAESPPKDPGKVAKVAKAAKVAKVAKVGNPHGAAPILLRKYETGTAGRTGGCAPFAVYL